MAETDPSSQLQAATTTPVAKLSPDIQDPTSRVVRGVVTIVWPYSAFKNTTAFILAEADFRLRRDQGQVRVELSGPCAKAFSDAAIVGGDEVVLSLDGVTWADKDTKTPIAGTPLPWQLRFKQRLLLQAGDNSRTIDVNEPNTEPDVEPTLPVPEPLLELNDHATTPRATTPEFRLPTKRRAEDSPDASEFASPAFIKRARVSYGSLFEGGLDIFDEEALNGGAKKRAKSGRFSNVWRYASRSPTPEPAEPEPEPQPEPEPVVEPAQPTEPPPVEATPLRTSLMVDGGCQTDPQEFSPLRDVGVIGEPRLGAFGMDETPSKPPAMFTGIHLDQPNNYGLETPHETAPYLSPSGTYQLDSSYPEGSLGQPALGAAQQPQHLAQPSFAVHALQEHSYHTTPDSYRSPVMDPEPLQTEFYPAPDVHVSAEDMAQPSLEAHPDHRSPYDQDVAPADDHATGAHHTVFLDRIAEPPASTPWGFVSTSHPNSGSNSGHDQDHPVELGSSSSEGSDAGDANADEDDDADPSAFQSSNSWGMSAGRQAESEVMEDDEEDVDEEDDTMMNQAPNDGEDRFEATSRSAIDTPVDTASLAENDTDASGEEEVRDAGGDYDISQYPNLSHMQDDDNASRVESEYSSEDENHIFVASNQDNEDDEIQEDVESFDEQYDGQEINTGFADGEEQEEFYDEEEEEDEEDEDDEDEEEDYDEDEVPSRLPPKPQGQPEVIDLLSDTDDDDDAPAPQQQSSRPAPFAAVRPPPQMDGSDESDDKDEGASSAGSPSASEENVMEQEEEAEEIQTEGHVTIPGHAVEAPMAEREPSAGADTAQSVRESSVTRALSDKEDVPVASHKSVEKPAEKEEEEAEEQPAPEINQSTAQEPKQPAETVEKSPAPEPEQPAREPGETSAQEHVQELTQAPTDTTKPGQAIEEEAKAATPAAAMEVEAASDEMATFVAVEEVTMEVTVTETEEVVLDKAEEEPTTAPIDTEMADAEPVRPSTPKDQTEKPVLATEPARSPTPPQQKEKPAANPVDADLIMDSSDDDDDDDDVEIIDFAPRVAALHKESANEASTADVEMADASEVEEPVVEEPMVEEPTAKATSPASPSEAEPVPTDTPEKPASPPDTQDIAAQASPEPEAERVQTEEEEYAKLVEDATVAATSVEGVQTEEEEYAKLVEDATVAATRSIEGDQQAPLEDPDNESNDEDTPTPKAGLPTPDDTQLQDEYSQGDIDLQLQLTQEEYESTPVASPRPTTTEGPVTRSMTSENAEQAKSSTAIEKAAAPSTPTTRSAPRSLDSRQTSEAASSSERDGAGPSKTRQARSGRSRGKERSSGADADPSVRLARASIASRRSARLSDHQKTPPENSKPEDQQKTPPENVRVTRAVSHNMMRSVSPIDSERDESVRLAKAALQSPSRQLRTSGSAALPTHRLLASTMREDVPDCLALKMLRHHPKQTVDVMAIVTTEPPEPKRAKSGPRGVLLSFNVTDHSIAPSQVILVNVFRPNKSALPEVKPGDVILLRQFTVTAMMGRGFGLRANDGSSWAVFDGQDEDQAPQIRGPPVELTKGDKTFAGLLKKYYTEMDAAAMAHLRKTNDKALAAAERVKGSA
ncbi:hypothetical protein F5X68DRAFT_262206 [Plectosphaerella plurivora]|uniref:Telomeric single stranded DNA binding POT1/Cdc13 domain-containing protein n=1 Tax=Plectosphaerella plurivora TaxID=936078 RepID=A0A9P9ABB5_9PEZI|nr:hypothetical protein F5X68DRAFT_262206 [Plectosphaerella plurivora]